MISNKNSLFYGMTPLNLYGMTPLKPIFLRNEWEKVYKNTTCCLWFKILSELNKNLILALYFNTFFSGIYSISFLILTLLVMRMTVHTY